MWIQQFVLGMGTPEFCPQFILLWQWTMITSRTYFLRGTSEPSGNGGELDAAGSTVVGRESCEGTAGMISACVPAAQATTVELNPISSQLKDDFLTQVSGDKKRNASTSPVSDPLEDDIVGSRRLTKDRIVESAEIIDEPISAEAESNLELDDPGNIKLPSSSPDNRVIRRSTRAGKHVADFSKFAEARQRKLDKSAKSRFKLDSGDKIAKLD